MAIYDVARNDMARTLSVLKRPVGGEDPRIPPDFIIRSAINDKVNRVACMEVILNDNTEVERNGDGEIIKDIRPEYHFIAGDEKGWNTEKVMVLGPQGRMDFNKEMDLTKIKERLALEGIEVHNSDKNIKLTVNRESLASHYNEQFEKTVKEIKDTLSAEEQETLGVFKERIFQIAHGQVINNPKELYASLPQNTQDAIPQKAFEAAFESISSETRLKFFTSIQGKTEFSYEDLPLRTALTVHQNLKSDPWK